MLHRTPTLLFLALFPLACTTEPAPRSSLGEVRGEVSPPLALEGSAYEAAARVSLPEIPPGEYAGLHNVFALSDSIISGDEPADRGALERIASWGVKTILSVDGKAPDADTAEQLGMRYVHVPIQYKGIERDELLKIAKTFRELEGPFYVHCFHGKHRGPAAAAMGRVVVDGVPRDRAIAEMRQWCATSSKYEGLYDAVARADIPTPAETAAFDYGFDPEHSFEGLRAGMVLMARAFDGVKLADKSDWLVDPDHPDIDPLQQATQLSQLFELVAHQDQMASWQDDYRDWMEQGRAGAEQLVGALSNSSQDRVSEESWRLAAEDAYALVAESCASCHSTYRN
jgi:protein tyrosine phosphatase (PTP) superfamily phosphohydrolase (DUF442 family)